MQKYQKYYYLEFIEIVKQHKIKLKYFAIYVLEKMNIKRVKKSINKLKYI